MDTDSADNTVVLHVRVAAQTRDGLRDHAHDLGRTFAHELRTWMQVGAAASAYAATLDARATGYGTDSSELADLRAEALDRVTATLAHALPTIVAPTAILDVVTGEVGVN
jgi:hypothetical protein